MRTKTRDTSRYGFHYLSGLLRMDKHRNMATISRNTGQSAQNMQHFISNSPWSSRALLDRIQEAIISRGEIDTGAMLLLDESADEKAGEYSVGTARQYDGRHGKVDNCQVGVFLSVAKGQFSTWIDGEVFLPHRWFDKDYADHRQRAGIPSDREFRTKPELGWQMIQRVSANGLPFEAVACDSLYGRSTWFRDQLAAANIEYYADVPCNTRVYLAKPQIGIAQNKRGKPATTEQVLSPKPIRVDRWRDHPDTLWKTVDLRTSERGILTA